MKYKYKVILAETKETATGRIVNWPDFPTNEWRFVALIPPDAMLFEKSIEENPTITVEDTQTSGSTSLN